MTLDPRRERIAANEARFREINERLAEGLRRVPHMPERLQFVCECAQRSCDLLLDLTLEEYEAVRADSRHFAVARGHVVLDAERVIRTTDRFDVIEKIGEAVAVTDATDPRAQGEGGNRRSTQPGPSRSRR